MTEPEDEDIYFDDAVHSALINFGLIYADPDHEDNALWHWVAHITPFWMWQHFDNKDEQRRHLNALKKD